MVSKTSKFKTCHTLLLRFDAPLPILKIPNFPLDRTRQQHSPYFFITVVYICGLKVFKHRDNQVIFLYLSESLNLAALVFCVCREISDASVQYVV